jgi:superfamily II DNA or RNA helicase
MPAVKLGRWDGTVSFFTQGGLTFVNLLDDIVPILEQQNYTFDLDDRRQSWDLKFDPVDTDTFKDVTWPKGHTHEGQPIELRDHQVEVINNFINNPQCLQEVATAAGKTIITAALSKLIEPYGRSIIIVPNKSLVTQTEEDYKNMGLDVGVYFGDRKEPGHTHTICTWQSLNILEKKRQNAEDNLIEVFKRDVVCVIVDEVHQAKADVLRRLLTNVYGYVPIRWGLTGTIPKADYEFKSIHVALGEVINRVSAAELQQKGLLAKCNIEILQLWDYVDYKNYREEQTHLVTKKARIEYIARMVEQIRKAQDKDFVQVWDVCSTAKFSKRHLTERKKFYKEAQYPFTVTKVDYQ